MPVGRGKSLLVGAAVQPDGSRTTAYRALEELVCARCARPILPACLFSRRTAPATTISTFGVGWGRVAICVACRPLRLDANADG